MVLRNSTTHVAQHFLLDSPIAEAMLSVSKGVGPLKSKMQAVSQTRSGSPTAVVPARESPNRRSIGVHHSLFPQQGIPRARHVLERPCSIREHLYGDGHSNAREYIAFSHCELPTRGWVQSTLPSLSEYPNSTQSPCPRYVYDSSFVRFAEPKSRDS